MIIETVKKLFKRDLEKLKQEISLYKDETKLWVVEEGIANSTGNLCLHLIGNLNTYIGAEIGNTGYIRHRELEFSLTGISRTELLEKVESTMAMVDSSLSLLKGGDLEKEYPLLVFTEKTSMGYLLIHLTVHLGYHLGQINYHRRMLDK